MDIPKVEKDGNVAYENFATEPELLRAKSALRECRLGATAAADTVRRFDTAADCDEATALRLRRAFGLRVGMASHADLFDLLKSYLLALEVALQSRPLRLVNRPDIIVSHLPIERPVPEPPGAPMQAPTSGDFQGFRIICGTPFLRDRTPHAAAAMLYHELSHRICGTKDLALGEQACRELTGGSPRRAIENADNHGLFVLGLLNERLTDAA